MMYRHQHQWHWSVAVIIVMVAVGILGIVEGKPDPRPLSHQQQLRRRGLARGRNSIPAVEVDSQSETTEPIILEYTPITRTRTVAVESSNQAEQEKQLKIIETAMKAREQELETIKEAFMERERVLEDREYALDIRDSDLDQRSNNIDKQVLETDKRLKEREDRIAARETALGERESEILKLAEQREQEINRLTKERENAAELREKAIEDRERALDEREKKVEDREIRVQKRMEANRKRFQRRRELSQLEQRMGTTSSAPSPPTGKSNKGSSSRSLKSVTTSSSVDQSTQASANHPRRVVEKVTLRKVTSAAPSTTVSEATSPAATLIFEDSDGVTTALSPDERFQVTEAVAYESAKEYYAATASPVKGETTIFQQGLVPVSENSVAVVSGKKRKSGKRRARQRRQGHHDGHHSSSHHRGSGRKHKVRKVVKRMGTDGTMVIISSKHAH